MATCKVMNFSISGGDTPWSDNDRHFLDLWIPTCWLQHQRATPATGVPDPVGQVNHRGPWVLTVAASTKDQELRLDVISERSRQSSAEIQNIPIEQRKRFARWRSADRFSNSAFHRSGYRYGRLQRATTVPAKLLQGSMALIRRGNCTFTEKITNAFNAGEASMVVIWNNQPGTLTDGHYRTAQRPGLQHL